MEETITAKGSDVVEEPKDFLEEVKAEREKMDKTLAEYKELKAKEVMSGDTPAGQIPPVPEEETPLEYANKLLKGEIKENAD